LKTNISLEEAQSLLFEHCSLMQSEQVHLKDSLGRVLSEDLRAQDNIPPFDRSPYDGYAFRAEDTLKASQENPVTLRVIDEVPAGYTSEFSIEEGTAVKILTGAPIPEGADAITKYEDTLYDGKQVTIFTAFKSGENVVPAGEDVKKGTVIAPYGTIITPPICGLIAALGLEYIPVFRIPKIAIVSTGDELVEVSEPLIPGKIRNTNCYTLYAYIKSIGAEPIIIGTAKDRIEEVAALIEQGVEKADMVLTTGGVSVGDYDVVSRAVESTGAESLYWKIEMKPGSATFAGVKKGKVICGLSGNPSAAMINFHLVVVPFIKKMAGRTKYMYEQIEVTLKKDFKKTSPRRRFLRGSLLYEEGCTRMVSTGEQGNGVLSSMIGCNILTEIPEKSGPMKSGEKLLAYLID
jgi:molybdopterin molybdotransferase